MLQSALSAAVREELLTRNVAALVRVPLPRPKRAKAWTASSRAGSWRAPRAVVTRCTPAYVLMLVLGLRRGELLGLAWDDVDVSEATAWIGWQLQRVNGGLVRRQTKTSASDAPFRCRTSAFGLRGSPSGRGALADGCAGLARVGLVFTSRLGTPVDPRTFIGPSLIGRSGGPACP